MKHINFIIYTIVLLIMLSITSFSQTINGRLGEFETNANYFDSTLNVTLQIKLNDNESAILGHTFNLKFDYDTLALQFIEGIYINFNESEGYQTETILRPGGSATIQNIETQLVSGAGREVTSQYIDFVLFKFQIIDFSRVAYVCPHNNAWGFHFYSPTENIEGQDWEIGEWICFEGNVPVELTSFTVSSNNDAVILNWSTATETNNSGFEVQRNGETIAFVQGNGTTTYPCQYTHIDNPDVGIFLYRLKQIDFDGTAQYFGEVEIEIVADEYILYQNYPNPFNPSTTIKYELEEPGNVTLTVYDLLGCEVQTLVNSPQIAGVYEVEFTANDNSTSVYIYRLQVNGNTITKKMTLLK